MEWDGWMEEDGWSDFKTMNSYSLPIFIPHLGHWPYLPPTVPV